MKNVAAVDIGGTNTKVAVVGSDAKIITTQSFPTQPHLDIKLFIGNLNSVLTNLNGQHGFDAVGIGAPNYNPVSEMLESPPNLSWGTLPLKKILQENLSWKCILEKDANLAALGELHFGLGSQYQHFVFITIGTGIGSGVILNKLPWRGMQGLAGEAGHMVVGDQKRKCGCGGLDHLEAYSSVTAIRKRASDEYGFETSFTQVLEKFATDDPVAVKVFNESAFYMARGIVGIFSLIAPEVVVLGGGGMAAGDKFLDLVRNNIQQHVFSWHKNIPVMKSRLGINEASLLGAASLVL